jgi:hypothetical protein
MIMEVIPDSIEGRHLLDMSPLDSVDIRKHKIPARRLDQMEQFSLDRGSIHYNRSHGTGTIPPIIGGFKVNSCKYCRFH